MQVGGDLERSDVGIVMVPRSLTKYRTLAVNSEYVASAVRVGNDDVKAAGQAAARVDRGHVLSGPGDLQLHESGVQLVRVQWPLGAGYTRIVELPMKHEQGACDCLEQPQDGHRETQVLVSQSYGALHRSM
jgi:hypothetical protein